MTAPMVTPEQAAAIAQVSVWSIYARIEAESVHFLETAEGSLLLSRLSGLVPNSMASRTPVPLRLQIGDDAGSTDVLARIIRP